LVYLSPNQHDFKEFWVMCQLPKKSESPPNDSQKISKWARVYSQNRSLGVVVSLGINMSIFTAIAGSSLLGGISYRSGNMRFFWVSIVIQVLAYVALVYFCVPRWGGMLVARIAERLYAKEGRVAFSASAPNKRAKFWGPVLGVCFGTCISATVALGFVVKYPIEYMQPISAIYMVPFLVGLWFLMRPMVGRLGLLWPLLYAIHAVLIVAGAPIVFTGPWNIFNMLIPVAGYGMLAAIVQHIYSRIALRRLKRLTRVEPTGAEVVAEEVNG
jgi:hypothetical protein